VKSQMEKGRMFSEKGLRGMMGVHEQEVKELMEEMFLMP